MIRVADYIIRFIEKLGVTDVFTVSGGGSIFLCDALGASTKLRYICCHHEQAVAMATESYARVRNRIGVSIVTTGPGGTNAITGVAGSWMDSVPHLILSGQVFLKQTIGKTGLRQLGVQEINIVDLVKPVTKYAVMVDDPKKIRYHLEKAVHLATTGRPGPVWLDLPADIQNAKVDPETLEGFQAESENAGATADVGLRDNVREVVALLARSRRPLIHVGQGVRIAGAEEELLGLITEFGIPFVTARNANDLIATDHPLHVGRPGTFAQRPANFAVQNADFYLAVGTRLSLPQTGYDAKDFARNAKRVMVDIDQAELDKPTLDMHIKIRSDAKAFLTELRRELAGTSGRWAAWIQTCADWRKRYPVVTDQQRRQERFVNSYHFVDLLSDMLAGDDIVVTDMGISFQGTHQALRVKKGQRFFTNSGFASMGWGLPAAVGAAVGGRRRTICLSGDGGLQMNIQELATVKHHRLPVKLFVMNNGGYLTIKQTQEMGFQGRLMGVNVDTGLSFPDFQKVAEAYGIPARRVDSHDALSEAIRATLEDNGPAVCELVMDPDQAQVGRAVQRKRADGSTEYTPLEDLHPFLSREELSQNMVAQDAKDRISH